MSTRLRDALDRWQDKYPDLGLIPEVELLRKWRPDGKFSQTEPPEVKIEDGIVLAACATEGAVIGWTAVPPHPPQESANDPFMGFGKAVGNPEMDGRSWQLYTEPFTPPADGALWFRAHRLGYLASDDVTLPIS